MPSSVPATTMRSRWIAVSECRPQPALSSTRSAPSAGRNNRPGARLGRQMRMKVDRHVEFDCCRQQAVIARMIEEAALGGAVDQRADEAQLLHGAFEFGSAQHRGSASAAPQSRRSGRDGGRSPPPDGHLSRGQLRRSLGARHQIGTMPGVREHLDRDAGIIHRLQAPLADLGQQFDRVRPLGGGLRGRNPRRLMTAGSIRRTSCGAVKCSSIATTRMMFSPVGRSDCGIRGGYQASAYGSGTAARFMGWDGGCDLLTLTARRKGDLSNETNAHPHRRYLARNMGRSRADSSPANTQQASQISAQTGTPVNSATNSASTVTGAIVPSGLGTTGATGGSFSGAAPVASDCPFGVSLGADLTAFGCASDPLGGPTYQIPSEAGSTAALRAPGGGTGAARAGTSGASNAGGISSNSCCQGAITSAGGNTGS